MLDHDFIDNYTSGFQETIDAVKDYTLEWAEEITGIDKEKIKAAAELWGKAKTSFLLHARGIEHHSKGVDNVVRLYQFSSGNGKNWETVLRIRNNNRTRKRTRRKRTRT
jgi:anaerobic selenocysteine-containing dehydrogenase